MLSAVNFVLQPSLWLCAALMLAGCGGGTSTTVTTTGGGTPGKPAAETNTAGEIARELRRYGMNLYNPSTSGSGEIPRSTDVPLAGQAHYTGGLYAGITENGVERGHVTARVGMDVDFGKASRGEADAISGQLSEIRGSLFDHSFSAPGTLHSAPASAGAIFIEDVLIGGSPARTGTATATFSGDVTINDQTGPASVTLGGDFYGPGGSGIAGNAGGTLFNQTPGGTDYTASGMFYANRD